MCPGSAFLQRTFWRRLSRAALSADHSLNGTERTFRGNSLQISIVESWRPVKERIAPQESVRDDGNTAGAGFSRKPTSRNQQSISPIPRYQVRAFPAALARGQSAHKKSPVVRTHKH